MTMEFCYNCNKTTGHARKFGIGTIIMILITWGFWILVMPCYPTRCIKCGQD